MTYADALAWLRYATALPWKSSTQQSTQWTAHSMKSTLLACGAQLIAEGKVTPEERMLQGHHRQGTSKSLRIYSRDDVHGQLSFQQKVIDFVRRGGRFMTAQHRGAQHSSDSSSASSEESDAAETKPNSRKKPRTTANVSNCFCDQRATRHVAHFGRLEALP